MKKFKVGDIICWKKTFLKAEGLLGIINNINDTGILVNLISDEMYYATLELNENFFSIHGISSKHTHEVFREEIKRYKIKKEAPANC